MRLHVIRIRSTIRLPRQHGFSMLELLIAVIIVSVGLLGIASMQAIGLRNNHSAYMRSQATILAYDIVDRMRANYEAAVAEQYNIAMDDDAPTCGTAVPACDLNSWLTRLGNTLPNGDGSVTVSNVGTTTVIVQWTDDRDNPTETLDFRFDTRL